MDEILVTRLRYVKSKDPDKILQYLNRILTYKVEIKGAPVFAQKKWYLWFVLPEVPIKELIVGDLD